MQIVLASITVGTAIVGALQTSSQPALVLCAGVCSGVKGASKLNDSGRDTEERQVEKRVLPLELGVVMDEHI